MMSTTVRSAVVAAMIGVGTLGAMGLAGRAPLDELDDLRRPGSDVDSPSPGSKQEQAVVEYLTRVMQDADADAVPAPAPYAPRPLHELMATTATYSSGSPDTGTRTVVVKVHRDIDGAQPVTWFKSFAHDTAADVPLTLDTLFVRDAAPLPVIASIVARELSIRLRQPVPVGLDPATYQNFALTDDAVLFFFDQDQLPPGSVATEVSVPRSALAGLLAPGR